MENVAAFLAFGTHETPLSLPAAEHVPAYRSRSETLPKVDLHSRRRTNPTGQDALWQNARWPLSLPQKEWFLLPASWELVPCCPPFALKTLIGPLKWMGHRSIVVGNKRQNLLS